MQYHQRNRASRSSSEWDRVGHLHYNHQAIKPHKKENDPNKTYVFVTLKANTDFYFHDGHDQADRTISTS